MKHFFLLVILTWLCCFSVNAQDSIRAKKPNPIIYGEFFLGYGRGGIAGLSLGGSVNYQKGSNLFTYRGISQTKIEGRAFVASPIIYIPYFEITETLVENSLLYGKRFIVDNESYSFSAGVSLNTYINSETGINKNFIGLPLEVNIKWFKSKKKRYRILYGLVPIGKPTAFGRSFGLKLYGNISEKSYFGFGLIFGLGYHKIYSND